jgi:hypothetical protein
MTRSEGQWRYAAMKALIDRAYGPDAKKPPVAIRK